MKKSLYHTIVEHPDQFTNAELLQIIYIHADMILRGANAKIITAASLLLDQRERAHSPKPIPEEVP